MTQTTQPDHTTEPGDYRTTMRVHAPADAVFDALTTLDALTAWWTPATGSAIEGGDIHFAFDQPDGCDVHVERAARPTDVRWTVTACFLDDWVGTRPTFAITPIDARFSEVEFCHQGLGPELECIEMCTAGWNHYMASLREYVESGAGMPRGSDADRSRRLG